MASLAKNRADTAEVAVSALAYLRETMRQCQYLRQTLATA